MASVECKGLSEIADRLDALPDVIKQAQEQVLESIGGQLLGVVQANIGGTGRIAGVQESKVGSRRGYVAVRPKAKTYLNGYAAGQITNALEHGHKTRGGRGHIAGKYMYANAMAAAAEAGRQVQAKIEQTVTAHMNGG